MSKQSQAPDSMMEGMQPPQIYVERTLAIIKPDAISKEKEIEEFILSKGFSIIQKRKVKLSPEQASELYSEHFGKIFFSSLVTFMSSGPIVALVMAKENAISYWRELIGPTNSIKAKTVAPERHFYFLFNFVYSLRAKYGTDDQQNALHGSDSFSSAEREIRYFFPDTIIEPIPIRFAAKDYLARNVNPTLLKGLTEVCKNKPKDPILWLADWLMENNPNRPHINEQPRVNSPC
ncbi:unnamed protein product [Protopolystoma xenopodis]|uniref:Nucleoside diphosphate kinase homolog 5 n=1 Tax=Protopolystoma xenopodis TaxID=117903 RepID=A0A3S5A7E7_9PLAT|nr:unnamed protein product [Protopolystoma xenopodis]